jgi:hypothetical protein
VDELPDSLVRGPGHGPREELAVLGGKLRDQGDKGEQPVGKLAVGREVVLPAENVVIDPRDARRGRVELRHPTILEPPLA